MIGIKWTYKDFINALKNVIKNDVYVEYNDSNYDRMKVAISKIFYDDLKGHDVEILREAHRCYIDNSFYPSQCFPFNGGKYKEGQQLKHDDFNILILDYNGYNGSTSYFCQICYDDACDVRRCFFDEEEIDIILKGEIDV